MNITTDPVAQQYWILIPFQK